MPCEREQGNGYEAIEGPAPANDCAEIAAQRRGNDRGQCIAAIEHGQRTCHLVGRHQPHGCGSRHRPKPAHDHTDQRASGHVSEVRRCQRDDGAGQGHHTCEAKQQGLPVHAAGKERDEKARDDGESTGDGDALACHPFRDVQVGGHRGQQAYRHELGGDQSKDAERHCEDTTPVRPRS
ncbi:hypothetical protein D9M72_63100 [compost metagenome]